jgi:hypothetical protein
MANVPTANEFMDWVNSIGRYILMADENKKELADTFFLSDIEALNLFHRDDASTYFVETNDGELTKIVLNFVNHKWISDLSIINEEIKKIITSW